MKNLKSGENSRLIPFDQEPSRNNLLSLFNHNFKILLLPMIKQCLSVACIFIVSITNAKAARQKEPKQPGKIQRKKENFYGALIQGEVP